MNLIYCPELYAPSTETGEIETHPPLPYPVPVQPYIVLPHHQAQEAHLRQPTLFQNPHRHIIVKMNQEVVTTVEMNMDQLDLPMSLFLKRNGSRY